MSKKIIAITMILVTTCAFLLSGCYKVATYTVPNDEEITRAVSLNDDLLPLIGTNCAMSGCHNSGGIKPDLTSDKVFNTLINGNYINTETPENSEFYLWLTGKKATTMPVGIENNPSNINQLVLAWIKQGAQNN